MKSYDLKPTRENLLSTYRQDVIDRNGDIFMFIELLNMVEDSCSIALEGNWGSGKTFFVKQVKMVMDAHNDFIDPEKDEYRSQIIATRSNYYKENIIPELQPQVCVYYDAWENDNDEDPIISLVYTILNEVSTDFSFKNIDWAKKGASIMELFSGKSWTQLIENLKGTSPLDALKEKKDIEQQVGEFFDALLPEKGNRLVVFIDELDRCKPSYAVRLLERIKHYFSHENITFVFSVNINELRHTIEKHYGEDFNSSRYLDRFFDLRVTLPSPNLRKYYESLNFYNDRNVLDIVCDAVINEYHMELREIARFLRLTKIAAQKPIHDGVNSTFPDGMAVLFCLYFIVPIVLGLRVVNMQRYSDFIEGRDFSPMLEVAERINSYGFRELLGRTETFDDDESRTHVTIEEKMKDVYNAVFVTDYSRPPYNTMIGKMEFNARTKDVLLRTVGLLSQFTSFDED